MTMTGDNNGMYMPVVPQGYGAGGDGMFGGNWAWWIIILLIFGGWGNGWGNGFGGNGGVGSEVQRGFDQSAVMNGINGITTGLCNGFAGVNQAIASGFARYRVAYDGNIAVPTGGTAGEIQLALAIGGEVVPTSIAAATPAAVDQYWNVSGFAIVDVPVGCCYTISVENASVSADPATTPASALNLRNLNVEVTRLA